METNAPETTGSKKLIWTGRVISSLLILALLFSAYIKFTVNPTATEPSDEVKGFEHLGWPVKLAMALGVVELVCTVLYAIPQTAVLGAILLTGYLGGAVATHVRIEEGFAAPVIVGVLVWLGLFLRDARLRALLPWRK